MPTIDSEVTYEGIMGTCHDDVVRFMAWVCLLHGTAGHTYGANGIWQVNGRTVPYGKSPPGNDWGDTPWPEAMALPGSAEVGYAKKLLEKYEWWKLEPHNEWAKYAEKKQNLKPTWGSWIWYPEGNPAQDAPAAKRYFRKTFDLAAKPASASLWVAVDDRFVAYVNGEKVSSGSDWHAAARVDVTKLLKEGKNVVAIEAENLPAPAGAADPAGLICDLQIDKEKPIHSDESWRVSQTVNGDDWRGEPFDDGVWAQAKALGRYGMGPWGKFSEQPSGYGPYTASIGDDLAIIYVPQDRAIEVRQPHGVGRYSMEFMNPVTGEVDGTRSSTRDGDKPFTISKPPSITSSDWVLVLRNVGNH
jgi:hypothetical protein